jgi:hypothetical protein
MTGRDSVTSLLNLRKLTRAMADVERAQIVDHLATLSPLLLPQTVFGDHIQGAPKISSQRSEPAMKELRTLFDTVAPAQPLNLRRELAPPFAFPDLDLELTPVDYAYDAQVGAGTKRIMVRSPLTWTLTYAGFAPPRLREMLDQKVRGEELQRFILSYLILHLVMKYRPGVTRVLEGLHFPVTTSTTPEFGALPMTRIGVSIPTERPSDAVIVQSAELTGMDAFEEVATMEGVAGLRDPLRERLLEIARQHAPDITSV